MRVVPSAAILALALCALGPCEGTGGGITDVLAPFLDIQNIASGVQEGLNLSDEGLQDVLSGKNTSIAEDPGPVDTAYPLSTFEMGLLLQLYSNCGTAASDMLVTWCTGIDSNGTRVIDDEGGDFQLCPRGVQTHPCTGRVLSVNGGNTSEIEYFWPWEGIKCDALTDPTTVTHVYLPGQQLKCRLQDLDFSNMISLEQLDLSHNELYGPFPSWLGNLTVLRFLNLRENQLNGIIPLAFADNTALEVIDVGHNRLRASTLAFFQVFTRLRHLDLSDNEFAVSLPRAFFRSQYFEAINISNNVFHGLLPEFPHFQHLVSLDVSKNSFEGELPRDLALWGREDREDPEEPSILHVLDFGWNKLSGALPPIANLTALRLFNIQQNRFEGSIPDLPPSLNASMSASWFEGNVFQCPLPISVNQAGGTLTCACMNGREVVRHSSRTANSNASVLVIDAALATELCAVCSIGSYSNASTSQRCVPCPMGHFTKTTGKAECSPCPLGTFANTTGASECTKCPMGAFADEPGLATCKLCPPGEFINTEGAASCRSCRAGTYTLKDASVKCLECPLGTFASHEGEMKCRPCPVRYYQDTEGARECKECPTGYIAPYPGHHQCVSCEEGTYFNSTIKSCRKCPPNTFTNESAQLQCAACEEGMIAEGFGNTECERANVPAGFGRVNGTTKACEPGYFNHGGFITCQACPVGRYSTKTGSSLCLPCPKGTYSAIKAAFECTSARAGAYVDHEGLWQAISCPPGHFTDAVGSTQCKKCPDGTTSLVGGTGNCSSLEDGEVFQDVVWRRIHIELFGVPKSQLESKERSSQLIEAWKNALVAHGGTDIQPHLVDTRLVSPKKEILLLEMALEVLPPPRPKPKRNKSNESVLARVQDTYGEVKDSIHEAKNTINDWFNTATGQDDGDYTKLRRANITDVLRREEFKLSLAQQLDKTLGIRITPSLMQIAFVDTPFESRRAIKCPKGTTLRIDPLSRERKCVLCPAGSFSAIEGAMECTPCPVKHYGDQDGLTGCWRCPLGEDALEGSTECRECKFLSRACSDFWTNVLLTVALAIGVGVHLWRRGRLLWRGERRPQQHSESVALLAAVRTHGRVWPMKTYAPMGAISAESIVARPIVDASTAV